MRAGIHPEYKKTLITCACGRVSETRATVDELHVEICSHCHPFFTGRQKLVDTAGRVERFMAKYRSDGGAAEEDAEAAVPDAVTDETTDAAAPEAAVSEDVAEESEAAASDEEEGAPASASTAESDEDEDVGAEASTEDEPAEEPEQELEVTAETSEEEGSEKETGAATA